MVISDGRYEKEEQEWLRLRDEPVDTVDFSTDVEEPELPKSVTDTIQASTERTKSTDMLIQTLQNDALFQVFESLF